jgi:hypothetical protein
MKLISELEMKINNDVGNEVVKWTNEVGLMIDNSLLKIIKIFKS